MTITRHFRETILERAQHDAPFRRAMLQEAINALLQNDLELAKSIFRDYINATVGFPALSKSLDKNSKSLQRMFGPNGNPTSKTLTAILYELQKAEGITINVKIH